MTVTVYSTPTCPYCVQVKRYLEQKGITYSDIDVSRDSTAAAEMVRISGQRGVPVTVIDEHFVVGFDPSRLDQLLSSAKRPRLGAAIADAETMAQQGKCTETVGAYVGSVRPESVAGYASIKPGDVIISIAGQPIRHASDIEKLLPRIRPDQRIPLVLIRGGQQQEVYLRF